MLTKLEINETASSLPNIKPLEENLASLTLEGKAPITPKRISWAPDVPPTKKDPTAITFETLCKEASFSAATGPRLEMKTRHQKEQIAAYETSPIISDSQLHNITHLKKKVELQHLKTQRMYLIKTLIDKHLNPAALKSQEKNHFNAKHKEFLLQYLRKGILLTTTFKDNNKFESAHNPLKLSSLPKGIKPTENKRAYKTLLQEVMTLTVELQKKKQAIFEQTIHNKPRHDLFFSEKIFTKTFISFLAAQHGIDPDDLDQKLDKKTIDTFNEIIVAQLKKDIAHEYKRFKSEAFLQPYPGYTNIYFKKTAHVTMDLFATLEQNFIPIIGNTPNQKAQSLAENFLHTTKNKTSLLESLQNTMKTWLAKHRINKMLFDIFETNAAHAFDDTNKNLPDTISHKLIYLLSATKNFNPNFEPDIDNYDPETLLNFTSPQMLRKFYTCLQKNRSEQLKEHPTVRTLKPKELMTVYENIWHITLKCAKDWFENHPEKQRNGKINLTQPPSQTNNTIDLPTLSQNAPNILSCFSAHKTQQMNRDKGNVILPSIVSTPKKPRLT